MLRVATKQQKVTLNILSIEVAIAILANFSPQAQKVLHKVFVNRGWCFCRLWQ